MPRELVERCDTIRAGEVRRSGCFDAPGVHELRRGWFGTCALDCEAVTVATGPGVRITGAIGERSIAETVALVEAPATFGARQLFVCPGCGARVGTLHVPPKGDRLRCRGCHRLTYRSCLESHRYDRLWAALVRGLGVTREEARRSLALFGYSPAVALGLIDESPEVKRPARELTIEMLRRREAAAARRIFGPDFADPAAAIEQRAQREAATWARFDRDAARLLRR